MVKWAILNDDKELIRVVDILKNVEKMLERDPVLKSAGWTPILFEYEVGRHRLPLATDYTAY